MPDAIFADPRLAELYDLFDPDRSDLDVYLDLARELGARSVLDIGCGTGTFACLLGEAGFEVTALDPAEASLDVARRKDGADTVHWVQGDARALPPLAVDLATMTGNVAQVFVPDEDWAAVLHSTRHALRPGGRFVFEVRDPRAEAWRSWTHERSHAHLEVAGLGPVERWVELTAATEELVSFRTTFVFRRDGEGEVVTSESTLRFRTGDEIGDWLSAAGFVIEGIRDAPDRPGLELVFVARRGE